MFSGIIEAQSQILSENSAPQAVRINLKKPLEFNDLKVGDSICTNGICLTIEKFDDDSMQFCLGAETLKLLGTSILNWKNNSINLERSLRLGDRVHGHLVTGHVDCIARIAKSNADGECWQLQIEIPAALKNYFWKKGSICLNGVSLTVNEVYLQNGVSLVDVCLIPETIKKTNLTKLSAGDFACVEADYLAKAYLQQKEGVLAELNP